MVAEIEHLCDPAEKNHSKFAGLQATVRNLYSANNQMNEEAAKDPLHLIHGASLDQLRTDLEQSPVEH